MSQDKQELKELNFYDLILKDVKELDCSLNRYRFNVRR